MRRVRRQEKGAVDSTPSYRLAPLVAIFAVQWAEDPKLSPLHPRKLSSEPLVLTMGHAKIASMLAPQYTLRKLLAIVMMAGFAYLIVAAATRGRLWAVATLIAMLGLSLTVLLQAVMFGIARLLQSAMAGRNKLKAKVDRRPAT